MLRPTSLRLAPFAVPAVLALAGCPPPDDADPDPSPASQALSWRKVSSTPPQGRWSFADGGGDGEGYVVGGAAIDLTSGVGAALIDVWRYDPADTTPGFSEVDTDRGGPAPRWCHCASFNEGRRELLVLGGRGESGAAFESDAWLLDVDTGAWTHIEGDAPRGAIGCSLAFADADRAYAFGGATENSETFTLDETWRFDADTRTFTRLELDEHPGNRYDADFKVLGNGDLLLVGGARTAFSGFLSEIWRLDVATERWSRVDDGTLGDGWRTPWVALADDDSELLIAFGVAGMAQGDLRDGVFRFHLDDASLEGPLEVDTADGAPPLRAFSRHVRASAGTVGLVWSGTDMAHTLDDLWALDDPSGRQWR